MKMVNVRRSALLVASSVLMSLFVNTAAFGANLPAKAVTDTSTSLQAASRRGVLGNFKRAVIGAASLGIFRQGPSVAIADDTVPTTGRVVELKIANLDGIEGNTGTVKIQLRPEWAPRGVKRFQVCTTKS